MPWIRLTIFVLYFGKSFTRIQISKITIPKLIKTCAKLYAENMLIKKLL